MKSCPTCQSTYEDWIEFCFNDGVPLVAYEPKAPAKPAAAKPAAGPPSAFDAPDARFVAGADLPEPANLGRFGKAASAFDAPEPPRASPLDAPTRAPAADLPTRAPAPEVLPPPTAIAAPLAEPHAAAVDPEDEPTTIPEDAGPPPAPVALAAPVVEPEAVAPPEAPAPAVEAPPVAAAAPAPGLDADALSDLASALADAPAAAAPVSAPPVAPPAPVAAAPAVTAPVVAAPEAPAPPVATPPAPAADPLAGRGTQVYGSGLPKERSVLDEDDSSRRKAAGAGLGVAVIVLMALGVVAVVGAGALWWMSQKDETAEVAVAAPKPAAPLPAAAPPPEPAPPPVEPPPAEPPAEVTAAATPPPAPAPAATTPAPAAAPVAAASKPPPATTGANAATPKPTTPPATTPKPSAPAATAPTTAAATTTSDSVWGTPSAPTSGNLRIVTDPDGATVFVNDAPKGKTPVVVELPYGSHQIKVQRAGYKTEIRDVNIRVRELTVPFNLKPEVVTGQVNVYGPDGFRVVVDGHDMGPMPVTVQVSEGVRQFKLVGSDGTTCNLPKEIKFKAAGRPETITLACP